MGWGPSIEREMLRPWARHIRMSYPAQALCTHRTNGVTSCSVPSACNCFFLDGFLSWSEWHTLINTFTPAAFCVLITKPGLGVISRRSW